MKDDLQTSVSFLDWQQAWQRGSVGVGGKAFQLALLKRYGLPVPKSFVVPVEVCRRLLPSQMWVDACAACYLADGTRDQALALIRERILQHAISTDFSLVLQAFLAEQGWQNTPLAVRSSAPSEDAKSHSFAGIHSSVLNVTGSVAIELALLEVMASLWTPQALAYRERVKLSHLDAAMAIVLMPMLECEIAGVVFTCDPRDGREDRLLISSVHGVAEALVAGSVDGEDVVVERDWSCQHWRVVQRRQSKQDASAEILSDERAIVLAKLALDTADAFDYTQRFLDIEWVFDGHQFFLVQARPISARSVYTYPEIVEQGSIWTRGNTKEILPFPMKVSEHEGMQVAVNEMLTLAQRIAGVKALAGAQRVALFNGYAYLNASLIQWEIYDNFHLLPEEVNMIFGGHQTCIQVEPRTWREQVAYFSRMMRVVTRFPAYRKRGLKEAAEVVSQSKGWREQNLRDIKDADLLTEIQDRARNTYLNYTGLCVMQGASGTLMNLRKMMNKWFPDEGNSLVSAIMSEGNISVSAQQAYDLMQLAKCAKNDVAATAWLSDCASVQLDGGSSFSMDYEKFLDQYGHRGNYESYVSRPTWREDPSDLNQAILHLIDADVESLLARQQQQVNWAWSKIKVSTGTLQRWLIKLMQKQAKIECNQRELARSSFAVIHERSRMLWLEMGRRLVNRQMLNHAEDIFHLNCAELSAIQVGTLGADAVQNRIEDRKTKIAFWQSLEHEDVIHQGSINLVALDGKSSPVDTKRARKHRPAMHSDDVWRGIAVSMGSYQGRVKRITHPSQIAKLEQGDIMLAPTSDPSWLPLFLKAGGVIVETGGYLSHSAIVARELAIPTVVNLPGIFDLLQDGDEVVIDGAEGVVRRLRSI
ncbi:PEP/pyruvate-binding domain-containing protein [Undibacterium sp.]|uniref:PEP/pyruvate-binding domain-containing protein n=1 Tax=Undibacterium sp. TaxID=1914977 RepID=UPI003753D81A